MSLVSENFSHGSQPEDFFDEVKPESADKKEVVTEPKLSLSEQIAAFKAHILKISAETGRPVEEIAVEEQAKVDQMPGHMDEYLKKVG